MTAEWTEGSADVHARVSGGWGIGRRGRRGGRKARCPPRVRAHGYKYELQPSPAAHRTDLDRLAWLGRKYACHKDWSVPRPRIALDPRPPASSPFASLNGHHGRGVSSPTTAVSDGATWWIYLPLQALCRSEDAVRMQTLPPSLVLLACTPLDTTTPLVHPRDSTVQR